MNNLLFEPAHETLVLIASSRDEVSCDKILTTMVKVSHFQNEP